VAYRSTSDVRDHVAACALAGVQSGFHVIGDAGMDTVLEGYEAAAALVGPEAVRATRPRLEHAEMVDAAGVRRMARLGMVASVQPAFDASWGGPDGMYAERLGVDRVPGTNPFASMRAAGVELAFGSDSPVTPFDPWAAVRAAAWHRTRSERLDPADAFLAHTVAGWRAARLEGGVLECGGAATFSVWDAPDAGPGGLPALAPDAVLPTCRLTLVDGLPLHTA
jgi:predicted amidohydrolase YtcJ